MAHASGGTQTIAKQRAVQERAESRCCDGGFQQQLQLLHILLFTPSQGPQSTLPEVFV